MLDITDPKPKAAPCPVNNNFYHFFATDRVLIELLFTVCLTVVQSKNYSNDQPSSSVFFLISALFAFFQPSRSVSSGSKGL